VRLEMQMAQEENTLVRLGDASIASPFTCRQSSIYPTTRIIQQGRCTLVTTVQIYKIQALTCLSMAYCMSALYLDGIKLGDQQMILSGLMSAMLFLIMSHAKPLTTLAPERPPPSICCIYIVVDILGQFAVHMYVLVTAMDMTRPLVPQSWVCSAESSNSTLAKEEGLPAPFCAGPCETVGCNACVGGHFYFYFYF
jgi:cation-transporting ATPase 13A1